MKRKLQMKKQPKTKRSRNEKEPKWKGAINEEGAKNEKELKVQHSLSSKIQIWIVAMDVATYLNTCSLKVSCLFE